MTQGTHSALPRPVTNLCPVPDLAWSAQMDLWWGLKGSWKLKRVSSHCECVLWWGAGALIYVHIDSGHREGELGSCYSTVQKLVTIETLCIGCHINAKQTDLFTDFLPFSSGWHKGREQAGREMDGSDVRSQSWAYPKRMHDLILQTACL